MKSHFIFSNQKIKNDIEQVLRDHNKNYPRLKKIFLGTPSTIKKLRSFSATLNYTEGLLANEQMHSLVKILMKVKDAHNSLYSPLMQLFSAEHFKVWKEIKRLSEVKSKIEGYRLPEGFSPAIFEKTCAVSRKYVESLFNAIWSWGNWITPDTYTKMYQHPECINDVNVLLSRKHAAWSSIYFYPHLASSLTPAMSEVVTFTREFINKLYSNLDLHPEDLKCLMNAFQKLKSPIEEEDIRMVTMKIREDAASRNQKEVSAIKVAVTKKEVAAPKREAAVTKTKLEWHESIQDEVTIIELRRKSTTATLLSSLNPLPPIPELEEWETATTAKPVRLLRYNVRWPQASAQAAKTIAHEEDRGRHYEERFLRRGNP